MTFLRAFIALLVGLMAACAEEVSWSVPEDGGTHHVPPASNASLAPDTSDWTLLLQITQK
jgi:hypothetical protein